MQGSNANVSHTINEDEWQEFTHHINNVGNNSALLVTLVPMLAVTHVIVICSGSVVDMRLLCQCKVPDG